MFSWIIVFQFIYDHIFLWIDINLCQDWVRILIYFLLFEIYKFSLPIHYKQPKTTRKIGVSNCKFTLQNRKIELTSLNIDCTLYFAPNAKISVFVHEVIEVLL